MKKGKADRQYVDLLKSKGFTSSEIMMAVTLKNEGLAMTKAIYKFNELYDQGQIDGFPTSSIEVLEMYYGKRLKLMAKKTLVEKVAKLQKCLDANIDYEFINEAVEYYYQ